MTQDQKKPICCGTFEKYAKEFTWMTLEDYSIYLMPHIGDDKYRINHCPTCGAEIRNVRFTKEEFQAL
jgi:hypothetical protein